MRLATARTTKMRSAAIAIGSQMRSLGLKNMGGTIEFAVVVTLTVTLSAALALELTTKVFRVSVVVTAQLDFGALVLQVK